MKKIKEMSHYDRIQYLKRIDFKSLDEQEKEEVFDALQQLYILAQSQLRQLTKLYHMASEYACHILSIDKDIELYDTEV